MSDNIVAILYLISALLFIFALRGLSHPESSRMGNIFGVIGIEYIELLNIEILSSQLLFGQFLVNIAVISLILIYQGYQSLSTHRIKEYS